MKIALTQQQSDLHQFILKTFATTGRSPTLEDVQAQFSLADITEAESAIADLEQRGAIHRNPADSLVTHIYPFSNEPTAHRVALANGPEVYSMCAVDALGIPFMLNTDATITSSCLQCGQEVQVHVKSGEIVHHSPDGTLVGYVPVENCCTPATEQCPHINFFCSQGHLQEWKAAHPEHDVKELPLQQALERGKAIFGPMMSPQMGPINEECCSHSL